MIERHRYSFFLDSACDPKKLGRFSFIGCDPFLVFKARRDRITLEWAHGKTETFRSNPFLALKTLLKRYRRPSLSKDTPFTSGAVGYFSYDLKDFVEELPDRAHDDLGLPDCIFAFYDEVIACDNLAGNTHLPPIDDGYLSMPYALPIKTHMLKSNFSKESYMKAIVKAKEYIKKGDIYQVNLSQRFCVDLNMDPKELYLRLRTFSPAPFCAYLDLKDVVILSSSPERFLLKRGSYIETRPIKGTRPRGDDRTSDEALRDELLASPKDHAEHIMIVDLERNDLGRICRYGSVRPTESAILEKYSSVFHLVSTVTGELRENIDPIDCLMATFPGGSITGAPKIRAMEIIEELEPVKRSIYTGAIGYISFDGNMDTSIAIRTFVIKDKKVFFQVGGGIVADSDPELEYEETLHKARGMLQALGIAERPSELKYKEPVLV